MIKKFFSILIIVSLTFSLVACKGKVKRVEPIDGVETEEEQGKSVIIERTPEEKEELEKNTLPEVELDDSEDNAEDDLSEDEAAERLEDITEQYGNDGPIILPEQILE